MMNKRPYIQKRPITKKRLFTQKRNVQENISEHRNYLFSLIKHMMFVFHLKTDHRIDSRVAMSTKSDNKTDKTDDKTADKTDKKKYKTIASHKLIIFCLFQK